jgi:ribosomal protein S18 acetylase RimI-like enzyme
LLALFRDTVRRVNCRDYSPNEIGAWASDKIDPVAWADRFDGRIAFVAEAGDSLVGFIDVESNGHIDRLYVSADHQRLGIATALLSTALAAGVRSGISYFFTESSITAKSVLESAGFVVIERQTVVHRGVDFVNFSMEYDMPPGCARVSRPGARA